MKGLPPGLPPNFSFEFWHIFNGSFTHAPRLPGA
jgi:hypothetical protein